MKKGKSRNKRKKIRSRLLWIAIAVIGIAAVISAVCVAGMLETKENAWRTPEELLVEYMDHIPKQEYEEMYTALRVQPLDETYRELSRKYLRPIGFEQNNMFIVDWSEDDFGALNFYDMYDILYPKVNGQYVPYIADDNLAVSAVYRIPKEEFESVIMKYFNIDSETLQSKTVYYSEDSTYEYKPRGFEEVEYPEYPYSEVVDFTENSDGTITLTANVVFPYAGDSKVFVVIRDQMNRQINTRFQKSNNNRGFQKCGAVNRYISVNSHFL